MTIASLVAVRTSNFEFRVFLMIPRAFFVWQAVIAVAVAAGLALSYPRLAVGFGAIGNPPRASRSSSRCTPVDLARWLADHSAPAAAALRRAHARRVRPEPHPVRAVDRARVGARRSHAARRQGRGRSFSTARPGQRSAVWPSACGPPATRASGCSMAASFAGPMKTASSPARTVPPPRSIRESRAVLGAAQARSPRDGRGLLP